LDVGFDPGEDEEEDNLQQQVAIYFSSSNQHLYINTKNIIMNQCTTFSNVRAPIAGAQRPIQQGKAAAFIGTPVNQRLSGMFGKSFTTPKSHQMSSRGSQVLKVFAVKDGATLDRPLRVAVIGGGPSGACAAETLAQGGIETFLIERKMDNCKVRSCE